MPAVCQASLVSLGRVQAQCTPWGWEGGKVLLLGIAAHRSPQVQAVRLIAEGKAPRLPQPEEGATYEGIQKKETAKVSAGSVHTLILPVSRLGL